MGSLSESPGSVYQSWVDGAKLCRKYTARKTKRGQATIEPLSNQRGCSAIPVKLPARSKRQRTANRHAKKEDVKAMSKFKNLDSMV